MYMFDAKVKSLIAHNTKSNTQKLENQQKTKRTEYQHCKITIHRIQTVEPLSNKRTLKGIES